MKTFSSIIKGLVSMFGKMVFALISFLLLLFLFSLLFLGIGMGIGMGVGRESLTEVRDPDRLDCTYVSGSRESENRLLLVSIQGVILGNLPPNMPPAAFFGGGVTYGYVVQDMLKKAAKDEKIQGILLHVQSPGGTIFGSYAIAEGVKAYQEATQKPVVAYIEGLAASGGVMAMAGANKIYADYGSIIGSIGVIGPQLLYYNQPMAIDEGLFSPGIVTEGGIEHTIIFAGRGKDLGNPFRRITEEELQTWQQGINAEYDHFVSHVAQNRSLDEAVIREKMGAQLFDNSTAEVYGLIDGTLDQHHSIAQLAELANVADDFQLVRPKMDAGRFWTQLLQGLTDITSKTEQRQQIQQQIIRQEICHKTAHISLVYYGDLASLCRM